MLDGHVSPLHFPYSIYISLMHHASDQWYNATAGSGSFHLKIDFKQTRNEPLTIEAFHLLKVIGKGSFGKVMQVRKKDTQRIYSLKTIRKAHIAQHPGHILAERTVLALVNNLFIVPQFVPESGNALSHSVCYFHYFHINKLRQILSQPMAENCFTTCNERENSIKRGADYTVSTSSIGKRRGS
jgi:serine/threonine protein kinase